MMASRSSVSTSTKRSTTSASLEPVAKPPCKIHSLALVADKAQLTGTNQVELGENTVLHPHSCVRAEYSEVIIGRNCVIAEGAVVGLAEAGQESVVLIGDNVNIETGAKVEAKIVGDGTVIEVNAKVGRGAVIGKCCKITPLSEIKPGEELADYTVVYGNNQRRLDTTMANNPEVREAKQKGQDMHVALLKKLIPDGSAKWR